MTNYVNVKQLLRAIYLRVSMSGLPGVSLKHEDIGEYVPDIEVLFDQKGIDGGELFTKTPVTETYDTFRDYMIEVLLDNSIGSFNNDYNTIEFRNTGWYAVNELKGLSQYQGLIEDCANAIIGRKQGRGTR